MIDCEDIELWRSSSTVIQYFVPEAIIGTVIMGLVGLQIHSSKVGTNEEGMVISQEKLMSKAEHLLKLLSLLKRAHYLENTMLK